MKKILFVGLLVTSSTLFAQKGSWYAGGAVGFSSSTMKKGANADLKNSSWAFSPEVGTFLTNKIQLGIGVTLSGYTTENVNINRTTGITHGGTVYGRYFFGDLAFKPFVGLNVSILPGSGESKNLPLNVSTKYNSMYVGTNLNAGFAYALSPRITAVGSFGLIGYSFKETTFDNASIESESEAGFDMNLSTLGNRFTVGVYYTFKGAKE